MAQINTDAVYKKIKKQNGEGVAKVIREAVLLDVPNIVHILEFAGNNPNEVQKLVPFIREIYKTQEKSEYKTDKNPLELLSDAGYDAFVVENAEQKNSIKKYFRLGEELCTFGDPHRHENYYMIHAVKRGANKIKPSDHPERQDEYGTSVISIQIAKSGGFISIKNRYNHTVHNPDNTFDSNPDKIIPGLTNSLKQYFHVDFNTAKSEMPDNFRIVNDQLVRYNYEINNIYFGSDYYFSGSEITRLNNDYELMLDCCILDKRTGQLSAPSGIGYLNCSYKILADLFNGKKIEVKKNKSEQQLFADGIHVATVKNGEILYLNLPNVTEIGYGFLKYNKCLTSINLPNVKKIGDWFLLNNENLTSINLPNVTEIGGNFLIRNECLTSIDLPNVTAIGDSFLENNKYLTSINLPNVIKIGRSFLERNINLTSIDLPNVTEIGNEFLYNNANLTSISLPNVTKIGDGFLENNKRLTSINLPNVTKIGSWFLQCNKRLKSINLPNVKQIGGNFLQNNKRLKSIDLPNVTEIGNGFLQYNECLTSINLPNVTEIGIAFLQQNKRLKSINAPNISVDNRDLKRLMMICAKNKLVFLLVRPLSKIFGKDLKKTGNEI